MHTLAYLALPGSNRHCLHQEKSPKLYALRALFLVELAGLIPRPFGYSLAVYRYSQFGNLPGLNFL